MGPTSLRSCHAGRTLGGKVGTQDSRATTLAFARQLAPFTTRTATATSGARLGANPTNQV